MFSCETKGTNKCPVSTGPCRLVMIPCVTQLCPHRISDLKLKEDINSERRYTPTLVSSPPASFILLFSSHLKGICLSKLSKSRVSKSVLSFPIGAFDLFPHSLLRQTEQSKEIFKPQKSHVADRAH